MVPNDLAFVRRVVALFGANGIGVRVFGGWAEELLRQREHRPHADLDLLYEGADFNLVDRLIPELALTEIVGKRFHHKRAVVIEDVMVELFLVQRDVRGAFTLFWGELRHDWPTTDDCVIDGIPVAAGPTVASYRAAYRHLRHPEALR